MDFIPAIVDPFDGFELPPGMTPDIARWKMINQRTYPIFPEYINIANPETLEAEKEITSNYTFVSRRLHGIDALKSVEDVDVSTKIEARKFFSFNSSRPDEFNYIDRRTHQGRVWDAQNIPLKFSYAGFHWRSPISLLIALSNNSVVSSQEFRSMAEDISQKYLTIGVIGKISKVMDPIKFQKNLKIVFTSMLKNRDSLYHKMFVKYRLELYEKWGYAELTDLNTYSGILYPPEILKDLDKMIKDILVEWLKNYDSKDAPQEKKHHWYESKSTFKPNTILEPLGEYEIDIHMDRGPEIIIYKIVLDDITSDLTRMNFSEKPYASIISYNPPILRGVTLAQQPFKVVVANAEISLEEIYGDTQAMRRTVTCDMITRSLDYAALNGLPLPPLGTEIFAHFADGSDAHTILDSQLPLAVYCRKRRHKFLIPFPDYSYGVFTTGSRFSVIDSSVMTWDSSKKYISDSLESKAKLISRENTVFFKGAVYSHSNVRESMHLLSGKRITDPMKYNETLIPAGKFIIDIPDSGGKLSTDPLTIPQMGKYRFLLDLPVYGTLSTRLKFIVLTKSIVIRVMFVEIKYDAETKKWYQIDPNDIWQTYFDTYTPFDIVETVVGEMYLPHKSLPVGRVSQLNKESRIRVITQVGKIYKEYNSNIPKAISVINRASSIVNSLTDDKISDYIYRLTMKMAELYGHIRKVPSLEVRDRCPPDDPNGVRQRCLPTIE